MRNIIKYLKLQEKYFLDNPKLESLENYNENKVNRNIKIQVHRNQSFEFIQKIIEKYLNFVGTKVDWIYGDYDDTLSFNNIVHSGIDIEIIWLDYKKYNFSQKNFLVWLNQRIKKLISITGNPILISSSLQGDHLNLNSDHLKELDHNDINIISLNKLYEYLNDKFVDEKRAHLFGTRLSRQSQLLSGRIISINSIYPLIIPKIKALAVDLDNTLYHGILGEDGLENLIITKAHLKLQEFLIQLSKNGFFVTIVSKNYYKDVNLLLEKKLDFRLQKRYLSGIKANWNNKYKNIEDLASELNIHPDSFLFIDDNIAELYEAKSYFKDISILQAKEDAKNTLNILENFPGIYGHKTGKTDLLRVKDIQSSVKRKKLTKNLNMADYHKELNTTIKFYLDRQTDKDRLSEITKKTNQFNLSLRQLSVQEVSNYINFKDKFVISIYVKDKISNSGNVGAIFFQYNDRKLMVHSICLSCRVLGRELENVMILQAIKLTIDKKKLLVNDVVFFHMKGPRNFPALKWLKGIKSSAEFFNKVSEVNIKYDKIKNILITDKNYNSCSLLF